MSRPLYFEHVVRRPLPDVLYVCGRCKRGIMVFLGRGDGDVYHPSSDRPSPYCYTCNSDEIGVRYTRQA